jgi:flagellar motor switch protein FliG
MEYMGPVRLKDIIEAREKILKIIIDLEDIGEIDTLYSKGGTVE